MNPIVFVIRLVSWLFRLFYLLLIVYCLLGWFAGPYNKVRRLLSKVMDPLLEPFRRLQRRLLGGMLPIDLSPVIALLAMRLAESALTLLAGLFRF